MSELKFITKKINSDNFEFKVFNKSGCIGKAICQCSNKFTLLILNIFLEEVSWIIHEITIHEQHRHQGIGTQLLQYAIAQMQSMANLPIVLVPAHEGLHTEVLLHWYRKHGFEQSPKYCWVKPRNTHNNNAKFKLNRRTASDRIQSLRTFVPDSPGTT